MAEPARRMPLGGRVGDLVAVAVRGLPSARTVEEFRRHPRLVPFLAALVLAVVATTVALNRGGTPGTPYPDEAPVPVVLGRVVQKDVPIYLTGIGTVQAYNTVQIKSRVEGELLKVLFREGQEVRQGDVLAVVDSRRLEANLQQMEAAVEQDRSRLAEARSTLRRLRAVKEFASKRAVEAQAAQVAQFEAQVSADQARVDLARNQLADAVITSPIDGRTGLRQVDEGNTLHPGDATPLVTVTQMRPISVLFSLNADTLPAIRDGLSRGHLPVVALAKDNRTVLARGRLDLVDNQVDPATGTVKLKASFPNEDLGLWPGQFVNARLEVATRLDGLTVPAGAIQQGPDGPFVWVVEEDDRTSMQPVVVSHVRDGEALVDGGLRPGQSVVVDGQFRLQPGSRVEPVAAPGPA